jgi:hypothetical protein
MISFITALAPGHSHVTAYISKRNQLPPIPPWHVHLMGEEKDLQELANEHSLGRTRLLHLEENYFLESDILNSLSDPNPQSGLQESERDSPTYFRSCKATAIYSITG